MGAFKELETVIGEYVQKELEQRGKAALARLSKHNKRLDFHSARLDQHEKAIERLEDEARPRPSTNNYCAPQVPHYEASFINSQLQSLLACEELASLDEYQRALAVRLMLKKHYGV